MCSYFCVFLFFVCSYLDDPHVQCSQPSPFSELWHSQMFYPSFWFDDVVARRDEDEAIVDDCYEALTMMTLMDTAHQNSMMINLGLKLLMMGRMKQWRFLSMDLLMMSLLMIRLLRRRRCRMRN